MNYNAFFSNIKDNIKIIFEIGSRDGLDAITLNNYFKATSVHVFEANSELMDDIKKNTRSYDNIKINNKAVYLNNDIIMPFHVCNSNVGASSLLGGLNEDYFMNTITEDHPHQERIKKYKWYQKYKTINVKTQRLDKYCDDNDISNIDLICIDVEGVGLCVIKSLGNLINNVKYIICEYNKVYGRTNQDTYDDINNYLKDNGFELLKAIDRDPYLGDGLWINKNK